MDRFGSFIRNSIFVLLFLAGFFMGSDGSFPRYNLSASASMGGLPSNRPPFFLTLVRTVLPITEGNSTDFTESEDDAEKLSLPQKASLPLPQKTTSGLQIANETDFTFNPEELLSEPLVTYSSGTKKVLIIHTHTSEAYTPSEEYNYTASDSYRTTDEKYNVVAVGEVIAEKLRQNGVTVIHDKTPHDSPEYAGSYRRALDSINKNIQQVPDIDIILDIHRDAISDGNGGYYKTHTEINGESIAQCMIIVGTNRKGLEHNTFRENIKYGLRLKKLMDEKYPSLARPLNIRGERFNGHAREGAMIIEIGSNGNTLEEALRCGDYVGECVAELAK